MHSQTSSPPLPGGSGAEETGLAPFRSILFPDGSAMPDLDALDEPAYFPDLRLDQVVAAVIAGRDEYALKPFFWARLADTDAVAYRHEVLRDLASPPLRKRIGAFAESMRAVRGHLAEAGKRHYELQRQSWFLDAAARYGDAVCGLVRDLGDADLRSRGFAALRDELARHVSADAFASLRGETREVQDALAQVRYGVELKGNRVRVARYEGEPDLSAEVERTFERFKQGAVKDYRVKLTAWPDMNHVEANILDLVVRLNPDAFLALERFCERHDDFIDDTVAAFDREVQVYLAYLEHMERLAPAGLSFCYPRVSHASKDVRATDTFDLALAAKLVAEREDVVANDFALTDPERILVVSGPNQGGKTTFARMFGQLHHLAGLGLPVPGTDTQLFLCDQVLTHFEQEEDIETLSGKLQADLTRIREILDRATPESVVVMNESFSSTTLSDARFIGAEVMRRLIDLDLLGVCVTFVDELSSMGDATVSMVSTISAGDPASRTFKLVRRPADGLAYAAAIAEKYGLSYRAVKERIAT